MTIQNYSYISLLQHAYFFDNTDRLLPTATGSPTAARDRTKPSPTTSLHPFMSTKGRSYRRTFCLIFQDFFFAHFFCISIFSKKKNPNIGMRSLPNIFPSATFPRFGNVPFFSTFFSCFSRGKKKRKIWGKVAGEERP